MFDPREWEDLAPLAQDDGPNPVVPIAYSAECAKMHNYLRALMKKGEKSARAVQMTEFVISYNKANYTAWDYRRQCLLELKSDLEEELGWCAQMALTNSKNYQLWHHRRSIVAILNSPLRELQYTEEVLQGEEDAKNYHAWAHRQWVLSTFGQWENELKYTEKLLDEDVRNNSAWNHRHFAIEHTTGFPHDIIHRELEFGQCKLKLAINNESGWNYLIGLLEEKEFCFHRELEAFASGVLEKDRECVNAGMCLVELYSKLALPRAYCDDEECAAFLPCALHPVVVEPTPAETAVLSARKICSHLINTDIVRRNFWEYQLAQFN